VRRIHELAVRHGRYGYRRITILLRREGREINRKRVHRIWKAEGLSLPLGRPRRRRFGQAGEIVNKAEYPNHVWSYDFLEDRTECGGKLRILVIIDEFTRGSLSVKVAPSIPALAVQGILEWQFLVRGAPNFIRSDNVPEFIAKAICQWLKDNGCQTIFIQPGSPWENGYMRVSSIN
jgi:putative transposase